MIGAIFGDIAGSKYEFGNIRRKDFELLSDDCYFTDDTVCTFACLDWLLTAKERTEETAKEYLLKWCLAYPRKGYGGRFAQWITSKKHRPYNSFGNGAAMRISPVAYFAKNLEELRYLSDTFTKITHNHEEGMKGALTVSTIIFMALHHSSKEEIKEYALKQYPRIKDLDYETLVQTYEFDETCQGSIPEAIYCFLISKDFEDNARTTISVGGDSDTTTCISSAIAEAYYGMPKKFKDRTRDFLTNDMKIYLYLFEARMKEEG